MQSLGETFDRQRLQRQRDEALQYERNRQKVADQLSSKLGEQQLSLGDYKIKSAANKLKLGEMSLKSYQSEQDNKALDTALSQAKDMMDMGLATKDNLRGLQNQVFSKHPGLRERFPNGFDVNIDKKDLFIMDQNNKAIAKWAKSPGGKWKQVKIPQNQTQTMENIDFSKYGWSEERLNNAAQEYRNTGKMNVTGRGKVVGLIKAQIAARAAGLNVSQGVSGAQSAAMKSQYKGSTANLQKQEIRVSAAKAFVNNMEKQIEMVKPMLVKLNQFGPAWMNIPLSQMRQYAGTPEQNQVYLVLTEIASEANRLAQGSPESIAAMPEESRKQWQDLIDNKLSAKDMMQVLETVNKLGRIRMSSFENELASTYKKIEEYRK